MRHGAFTAILVILAAVSGHGQEPVTPQGLTCCNVGRTHKDALESLCRVLVKQHEDLLGRAALDRKSARDQLQEYVESLVERNGP